MAKINPFAQLDPQEMGELLEKYDVAANEKEVERIKEKAFEKAGLSRPKAKVLTLRRLVALAAGLCIVVAAAILGIALTESKPQTIQTTAAVQTTVGNANPLLTAISKGDDSVIGSLLQSGAFLNRDTLSYALDFTSLLSYNSISDIARAVKEKYGTTGLDPLVENALLGNSELVIAELEKKSTLSGLSDRLAYFFSAAFCSSDVLRLFNQKGMDIDETDAAGDTVYEIAKKYGNEDNQSYALEMSADN